MTLEVFSEVLHVVLAAGAAAIVLSGLWLSYRESSRREREATRQE